MSLVYLQFDRSESGDGVTTLEALAATPLAEPERHAAVMAEVQQVLDWAWRHFPHSHGPLDEGHDWQHDLQLAVQDGGWHGVTLTLSGSDAFVAEFLPVFGPAPD